MRTGGEGETRASCSRASTAARRKACITRAPCALIFQCDDEREGKPCEILGTTVSSLASRTWTCVSAHTHTVHTRIICRALRAQSSEGQTTELSRVSSVPCGIEHRHVHLPKRATGPRSSPARAQAHRGATGPRAAAQRLSQHTAVVAERGEYFIYCSQHDTPHCPCTRTLSSRLFFLTLLRTARRLSLRRSPFHVIT